VMEFPPLPPSPVEEADEESCSDVGQSAVMTPPKSKSYSSSRTVEYRPRVPPHRVPPIIDPKEQTSLNTRSMDAGFARGRRTPVTNNSRREVSSFEIFSRGYNVDFWSLNRETKTTVNHVFLISAHVLTFYINVIKY